MKLAYVKSVMAALMVSALIAVPAFAAQKKEGAHKEAAKETVVPLAASPSAKEPATEPSPATAVPADAAAIPAAPINVPDTSNILFMQNMRKIGATIYYLGENLGLHGWFVVKDGQVQIIYTTPDQKALLIGALLSPEGANVSQQQVMVLANNNPEIQKILKGSSAVTGVAPKSVANTDRAPAPKESVSDAPSEKFFAILLKAANVTFGIESAPQLLMVMDVNCPHCHRAWKNMQQFVESGKLRVTMIPIGALGAQSEVEAANWLSKRDPYDAWKKHVSGDAEIFKSDLRDPAKEQAVHANIELIQKWGVNQTPYILYRGKNDKIRLIEGEPKSIDEIMSDIK